MIIYESETFDNMVKIQYIEFQMVPRFSMSNI